MGDYKSQYERYYGNMVKKSPGRMQAKDTTYDSIYRRRQNKSKSIGERYARKFIVQLVGAFVLLILLVCIKAIPIEGAQEAYIVSKEAIDKNYDLENTIATINMGEVENYKEIVLDYVDELKSMITGEETLKGIIKEQYITPVIGMYKRLEGEDKGLAIYTDEDAEIVASFSGTVREVKEGEDGKHVIIDHGRGVETYYGLLSDLEVEEGDSIETGEKIGKVGTLNDSEDKKGMIYKIIYMGEEKNPLEFMDFKSLQSV